MKTAPPSRSGNARADDRDDRQQRVPQRVAPIDDALRRPFAWAVRM